MDIGEALTRATGFLIAWVLYGIKTEITDIKNTVRELARNMENIDKRVVVLETINEVKNGTSKES